MSRGASSLPRSTGPYEAMPKRRVDVPLALGEFQKRLAENRCCHFRLRLFVVDFVEPDR